MKIALAAMLVLRQLGPSFHLLIMLVVEYFLLNTVYNEYYTIVRTTTF